MTTAEPPSSQATLEVRTSLGGPIAPLGFTDLQPPSSSQATPSITVDALAFLTQADGHPSPSPIRGTAQATFTTQALGSLAAPIAQPSKASTYIGARPHWDGTVGDILEDMSSAIRDIRGHTSQGASASRFPRTLRFSGSPGESAASFIRSVEQQARILLMTITALVQVFPHLLEAAAIDWYFDLDESTVGDWNMWKAAFLAHFNSPAFRQANMSALHNKRQGPSKPVSSFAKAIHSLGRLASAADDRLRDFFVNGLTPRAASYV